MGSEINLFANAAEDPRKLRVINGGILSSEYQLKCYKTALQEVNYKCVSELFGGFNTLKAITFSYDMRFVNEIMQYFDYAEILLGANFLVMKDEKTNQFLREVLTNGQDAVDSIRKYKTLVDMAVNGNVFFRTPKYVLDHRKIYLLKADDGKTRVIFTSANLSGNAFNGTHMEHYSYDDSLYGYNQVNDDFNTAWDDSIEIPLPVLTSEKSKDPLNDNPIIKKVRETGETILLRTPDTEPEIKLQNINYVIDRKKTGEDVDILINGINLKEKNGYIELAPKVVKKMEMNQRHYQQSQKVIIENQEKQYPRLTYDYETKTMSLDGELVNLNPSAEDIKKDINELLGVFDNFDTFISDNIPRLKENHYKILNAVFCSPFNARLRCVAKIKCVPTGSLPLFMILTSSTSNCGKTFMVELALKMMTGAVIKATKSTDCGKESIEYIQRNCRGIPFFIDEIDNTYMGHRKTDIKTDDQCENHQRAEQPMMIFASNDVINPHESIRKRAIFILLEAQLPSGLDQNAFKTKGIAIQNRIGTAFYREYFRRMLDKVSDMINYMYYDETRQDTWYPDLMKESSQIIIDILNDFNYQIPSYAKVLTWNDDYSLNSKSVSIDAMEAINQLWKEHKEYFRITKDLVIITLSSDKNSKYLCKSLENVLPAEIRCRQTASRDTTSVTMNRAELEKRMRIKFKKGFWERFMP